MCGMANASALIYGAVRSEVSDATRCKWLGLSMGGGVITISWLLAILRRNYEFNAVQKIHAYESSDFSILRLSMKPSNFREKADN